MPFNYNTQGITNPDANDPRNLGGSEGYGNPTASGSSGIMSSTANTTSNDDDNEPSFFESIANLFSGAGADLPSDNNDDGDSGASFYSGPMFGPFNNGSDDSGSDNNSSSTSPPNKPLPTSAADRAVYEALGIDVPEVYRGELGEWEPEPNINMDVLQKALQPDPIAVEEIEVKAGDTLSGIAKDKGVPVQDVINANPQIKNPDLIRPGEKVTVPDVYSGESTMERMARESAELAASKRDAAGITRSLTPEEVKERNAALKAASEDPDRKFYQSTIPIEDRTFPAEAEQADGIMSKTYDSKTMEDINNPLGEAKYPTVTNYLDSNNITSTDDTVDLATDLAVTNGDFVNRNTALQTIEDIYTHADPTTAKAFLTTIDAESGSGLIEGTNYSRDRAIAKLGNNNTARIAEINALYDRANAGSRLDDAQQVELFNIAYGGRMDNANNEGYKYRGRGLIQITGKAEYLRIGKKLGIGDTLVKNPDLLLSNPSIMLAATKAYLDNKGFGTGEMTANTLKDAIGHSGGAAEAERRWNTVITALEADGETEAAERARLTNEFTAQRLAGTTVDGDIGPNSLRAMRAYLSQPPRNITVPADATAQDIVVLVNENN